MPIRLAEPDRYSISWRQIQYKLVDGETGRILKIDKVLEF